MLSCHMFVKIEWREALRIKLCSSGSLVLLFGDTISWLNLCHLRFCGDLLQFHQLYSEGIAWWAYTVRLFFFSKIKILQIGLPWSMKQMKVLPISTFLLTAPWAGSIELDHFSFHFLSGPIRRYVQTHNYVDRSCIPNMMNRYIKRIMRRGMQDHKSDQYIPVTTLVFGV